jgi:phosphoribosylaminoimidazole-succinocarboxamide synthase
LSNALARSDLPFPLVARGKVRDIYRLGGDLLFLASDRLSAFDVVLPDPIPDKGRVLTQVSSWWFDRTTHIVANHRIAVDPDGIVARQPELAEHRKVWQDRAMLVRALDPLPVECVVRGYLAGSAWREYRESGTLAGERLPDGLEFCGALPEPIFSPATKAAVGDHDENIPFSGVVERVGQETAERLRETSIALYRYAAEVARERRILLADTKFEFALDVDGAPILIDEALTPDSSRYWPVEAYAPGHDQPSLDKQPVRDYLEGLATRGEWDMSPPGPRLPAEVIHATTERYRTLHRTLTGRELGR